MDKKLKPNSLMVGLASAALILVVAGIVLLVAYFNLSRQSVADATWANPLAETKVGAVAPDLAVLPLAGEEDERVIKAALTAGEVETAYAGLASSTWLSDASRSGLWLLLAQRFLATEPARARLAYRVALDQAALAPYLSDAARADLSLQAVRGFMALDERDLTRAGLTQAESIAQHSLTLLPAQRRAVLDAVLAVYGQLGDDQAANALKAARASADLGPSISAGEGGAILNGLRGSIVLPPEIATAILARQQAAAALAAEWLSASISERESLAADLGRALVDEDQARARFDSSEGSLTDADRLALLNDKIAWLSTKERVSSKGYGVSLVPAWENQGDEIRRALAEADTELINGYGKLLDALPEEKAATARVELLRLGLSWTRLGLFPGQAEQALGDQLQEAAREVWRQRSESGLAIVRRDVGGHSLYLLSGVETPEP